MGEMILLTEKSGFICNHLQPFATVINTDPQRVLRGYVANVADKMQKITLGVYIHTERNQFQILYVYL